MSLRFMGESQALIAMQRWPLTCSVEISCLSGVDGTEPFLKQVEQAALNIGGILHWGQRNGTLDANKVSGWYGERLSRWRAVRAKLSGSNDKSFSTPFSVRAGLDDP